MTTIHPNIDHNQSHANLLVWANRVDQKSSKSVAFLRRISYTTLEYVK